LSVRHGLAIVEDAAQAIGATYRGRHAGVLGTLGCFSFFPTKNLGGAGDGGMITTDDADLAARLRRLRVHGDAGRYEHLEVGMNSRLDALQAAVLRVKLRHLDAWTEARRENAARYREMFADEQIDDYLDLPADCDNGRHVYNQFCIRVRDGHRDAVLAGLQQRNIGCAIYYPKPLHVQHCFRQLGYEAGQFPESERASAETIALPIYAELGEARQRQVVSATVEAVREATRRAWTIPIHDAGKRAA
jgi:dTDP-4-amino-4,6-dideoxygalactose transaminase